LIRQTTYNIRKHFIFEGAPTILVLRIVAIVGGLLPFLWLNARIEYDDGWFTIAGYEWAFHGVPRIPAFAGSGTGDNVLHAMWPMVSGVVAIGIKCLSGLLSFIVCARLPMVITSLTAILLLGVRGSKVLGQTAAWGAAAFLALDSVVFLNARTVRPEALLLPIFVWTLLQVLMVVKGDKRPFSMFGIGVVLGAGWFLFHQNSVVVPGIMLGSAFLFSDDRRPAFRALAWTALGMTLGFGLYAAVAYCAVGDHSFKGTVLQSVGNIVMNTAKGGQDYLFNGWFLIKKWSVFPYRAIVIVCVAMAAYGVRKDLKMRFLVAAAFFYLIIYAVFRGSGNVRYMAYITLMFSPLIGTCLANRERIFRPLGQKLFVCIFVLTLLSGLGNVYEIWRVRSASETNLRAMIDENVSQDATIVGSLWIGGVVPERKLILDLYFPRYFLDNKDREYYLVEDGVYGGHREIVAFLKENGLGCRTVAERLVPRYRYIRISKVKPLNG